MTAVTVALPPEIFDVQTNIPLIHQVVVAQLAAARAGTHKTKTRGEVAGGGRKPYKQKGTGRARQGSVRAPQYAGGGTVHGPQPRDYSQRTPKKMKAAALRGVLSDRARAERVNVVDEIVTGDVPSTRAALAALSEWTADGRLLVVLARDEETAWKSLRNVPTVQLVAADQLSAYDAVISDRVVFTKAGLDAFVSRSIGIAPVQPEQPQVTASSSEAVDPSTSAGTESGPQTPAGPEAAADSDAEEEQA